MQPRDTRFWLLFESGERSGESVALPEGVLTIGRRPGNHVVVPDTSVSGKHAELHVTADQVVVQDLGSTNGTRVGGEKVERRRLAHGEHVSVGNVQLLLLDRTVSGGPPPERAPRAAAGASAASAAPALPGAEPVGRVSQERVARSARRSLAAPLLLVAVLLAAGLLAWRTLAGREGAAVAEPVHEVEGNLVADGSFEAEDATWEPAEAAPASFEPARRHARSGSVGLGVELAAGEWALAASPPFAIGPRDALVLEAALSAEELAEGRVGVELSSSRGDLAPWIVWARSLTATEGFQACALPLGIVPGYDRGRVVVAARAPAEGGGRVSLDDVVVVPGEAPAGGASYEEFEARTFGEQGASAAVLRSGRIVLPGIELGSWGREGLAGTGDARWEAAATAKGLALRVAEAPAGGALHLRFDTALAGAAAGLENGQGAAAAGGWIATLGPGGYRPQATQFEVPEASDLLVGRALDLVRVGFGRPVRLAGGVADGVLRVRAEAEGLDGFELQVTFTEERAAAALLAEEGAAAERKGQPGAALAAWEQLLDRYPFDSEAIRRAEEARGRLTQVGLEEVDVVRHELERARFFQLADLYVACEQRLEETARRYAGSEVEAEARQVIAAARAERAGLEGAGEAAGGELARIRAVLGALDPERSPSLVEHVRSSLERRGERED